MRGKTMTYRQLIESVGGAPQSAGQFVRPIERYCRNHELPLLSALIVDSKTGRPSSGFGEGESFENHRDASFAFDWLRVATPPPEDFEKLLDSRV